MVRDPTKKVPKRFWPTTISLFFVSWKPRGSREASPRRHREPSPLIGSPYSEQAPPFGRQGITWNLPNGFGLFSLFLGLKGKRDGTNQMNEYLEIGEKTKSAQVELVASWRVEGESRSCPFSEGHPAGWQMIIRIICCDYMVFYDMHFSSQRIPFDTTGNLVSLEYERTGQAVRWMLQDCMPWFFPESATWIKSVKTYHDIISLSSPYWDARAARAQGFIMIK